MSQTLALTQNSINFNLLTNSKVYKIEKDTFYTLPYKNQRISESTVNQSINNNQLYTKLFSKSMITSLYIRRICLKEPFRHHNLRKVLLILVILHKINEFYIK